MRKIITSWLLFSVLSYSAYTQLLYSNAIPAGGHYKPGLNSFNRPNVIFDDVQIRSTDLCCSDSLAITKLSFGISRDANSPQDTVNLYYTTFDDTAYRLNNFIKLPPKYLGRVVLPATTTQTNQVVSIGDSIASLFKIKLDTGKVYYGYQTFFVGLSFNGKSSGWKFSKSESFNANLYWKYDKDKGTRQAFFFGPSPNPAATFSLQVYGYKVLREKKGEPTSKIKLTTKDGNTGKGKYGNVLTYGKRENNMPTSFESISELFESISDIKTYPNPTKDYINVTFTMNEKSNLLIQLIAMDGSIRETIERKGAEGQQHFRISINQVGMYSLKVHYNSHLYFKTITKI